MRSSKLGQPKNLQMKGEFAQASLVAFIRAIGYIPLVYTTAIVTGVFSPAGAYFSVAAGVLAFEIVRQRMAK